MTTKFSKMRTAELFSFGQRVTDSLLDEIEKRSIINPVKVLESACFNPNLFIIVLHHECSERCQELFSGILCSPMVQKKFKMAKSRFPFKEVCITNILKCNKIKHVDPIVVILRCLARAKEVTNWRVPTNLDAAFAVFASESPDLAQDKKFFFYVEFPMSKIRMEKILHKAKADRFVHCFYDRLGTHDFDDEYGRYLILTDMYADDKNQLSFCFAKERSMVAYANDNFEESGISRILKDLPEALWRFEPLPGKTVPRARVYNSIERLHGHVETIISQFESFKKSYGETLEELRTEKTHAWSSIGRAHRTYFWRAVVIAQAFMMNRLSYCQVAIDCIIGFAEPYIIDAMDVPIRGYLYKLAHGWLMRKYTEKKQETGKYGLAKATRKKRKLK